MIKQLFALSILFLLFHCSDENPSDSPLSMEEEPTPLVVGAALSPSPEDVASAVSLNGVLSFQPGENTSANATYRLFLDTNANPTTLFNLEYSPSYTYTNLQKSTTYYWKIETVNNGDVVATSRVWRFTTVATAAATAFSPNDLASNIPLNGSLSFNAGAHTSSAATFVLYFDTNPNPSTRYDLGTATTYAFSDLTANTTYYWKVETIENNEVVATSSIARFTSVPPLNTNSAPSENFDLSTWKLTLPVSRSGTRNDDALEISVAELNDRYAHPDYFYTADDGGMVFKCTIDGARTSANTSYTRTELREMLRGTNSSISTQGVNENNWVFGSAPQASIDAAGGYDGRLEATLAINHVTTTGVGYQVGRVVIGQIHANNDEPIRVYYRKLPNHDKGTVYFAHEPRTGAEIWVDDLIGSRSSSAPNPTDGIALDERFSYTIDVVGNTLTFTLSREGKPDIVRTVNMDNSGFDEADQYMYFKAGVYVQNNSGDPNDYDQATFYRLVKSHSL